MEVSSATCLLVCLYNDLFVLVLTFTVHIAYIREDGVCMIGIAMDGVIMIVVFDVCVRIRCSPNGSLTYIQRREHPSDLAVREPTGSCACSGGSAAQHSEKVDHGRRHRVDYLRWEYLRPRRHARQRARLAASNNLGRRRASSIPPPRRLFVTHNHRALQVLIGAAAFFWLTRGSGLRPSASFMHRVRGWPHEDSQEKRGWLPRAFSFHHRTAQPVYSLPPLYTYGALSECSSLQGTASVTLPDPVASVGWPPFPRVYARGSVSLPCLLQPQAGLEVRLRFSCTPSTRP